MEIEKLTKRIMLLAHEDYSGLWEVYAETEDIFGNQPKSLLLSYARDVVFDLINKGWIFLYWCNEPLTNENVSPLTQDEIEPALSIEDYWDEPEKGAVSLRILTTDKGEYAYQKMLW